MLNIIIPMAGRGSRFADAGYSLPKPLIPVKGEPMVKRVIENLRPSVEHRFIFLCLREHIDKYSIDAQLKSWAPKCEIVIVDQVTEGAACTVLLASEYIDNDDPLMIANSDQWVDIDINDYITKSMSQDLSGMIMTMYGNDPKWSYVRFDEDKKICEVVEKEVVSNEATVGIYNFAHGKDFVRSAHRMIEKDLRVNGEFYVAPVYNEIISSNMNLGWYNIGRENEGMYGLGIPQDLKYFESLDLV